MMRKITLTKRQPLDERTLLLAITADDDPLALHEPLPTECTRLLLLCPDGDPVTAWRRAYPHLAISWLREPFTWSALADRIARVLGSERALPDDPVWLDPFQRLSPRQREIVELAVAGFGNGEIGQLVRGGPIRVNTVETHIKEINYRLGTIDRYDWLRLWIRWRPVPDLDTVLSERIGLFAVK